MLVQRAQRFRQRAAAFAQDFIHWFAADGAVLADPDSEEWDKAWEHTPDLPTWLNAGPPQTRPRRRH
jgi:hypothetical protein